jgi:HEAT repeat protein
MLWASMLRSDPQDARQKWTHLAVVLLLLVSSCKKSNEQWRADLDSSDPYVRGLAAIGLCMQSPRGAGPALPELLTTIDRSDLGLEREAAQVLVSVGQYHVPALLQELVDEELMSADRKGAIKNALVVAGPEAAGPIVACLEGPGSFLVGDLGDVLLAMGEPAIPAIVDLLEQARDVRLRNFAAYLLGRMGPSARSGLPALKRAAESKDEGLRGMALQAIISVQAGASDAGR